ncbi:hypothetical protein NDU88_007622 [Pleurodeles waltl]|uniref:Uncharacterized protein n=1 Tax=Pleurodeles waltl TaxID=8319 RepID=A0AAV7NTK8_PLEWA|nr:hypothetical protein NDU88_007622 [Pleurodeles waltl]
MYLCQSRLSPAHTVAADAEARPSTDTWFSLLQSLLEAQPEEDGRQDPLVGAWHAAAGSGAELGEGSTEADARPRVLRDRETDVL